MKIILPDNTRETSKGEEGTRSSSDHQRRLVETNNIQGEREKWSAFVYGILTLPKRF